MSDTEHPFIKKIFLLLSVIIIELLAQSYELKWPSMLLFGPALLFCTSSLHQKKHEKWWWLLHAAPFILFSIGLHLSQDSLRPIQMVSLFVYAALSLIQKNKNKGDGQLIIVLSQLAYIDMTISGCFLVLITGDYLTLAFDASPNSIIVMLLFLKTALICRYFCLTWYWESQPQECYPEQPPVIPSSRIILAESLLNDYEERLNQCLIENKRYLRSDLSLDLLVAETGIPKHHFSVLLNAHIGKSFYQLVAEYRIREAITLMQQEENPLTIEALAYECGFNSKSSFNIYFKEIVGCLPSEFRVNQLAK